MGGLASVPGRGRKAKPTEIKRADFLSRLCGGEVDNHVMAHQLEFLSRLCGGEAAVFM